MAQPISAKPDPLLVSQLNGGSGEALTALFDRYADAVYNYCFRRTASWHVAEDATATVFLEAWRGRERIAVYDESALPWLYGIANNVCRNLSRSARRHLHAVGRLPSEGAADDHADGVVDRLDSERQMTTVLAAVRRLPRREQEVLAMVVWTGLSYEQTAAALQIPVGTVRSRLSRARGRLTSVLIPDPTSTIPSSRSEDDHA